MHDAQCLEHKPISICHHCWKKILTSSFSLQNLIMIGIKIVFHVCLSVCFLNEEVITFLFCNSPSDLPKIFLNSQRTSFPQNRVIKA